MTHKYLTRPRPLGPKNLETIEKEWTQKIPTGIEHEFKEFILPNKRGKNK